MLRRVVIEFCSDCGQVNAPGKNDGKVDVATALTGEMSCNAALTLNHARGNPRPLDQFLRS